MEISKDVFKQVYNAMKEALSHGYELEIKYNGKISRDAFTRVVQYSRSQAYQQFDHQDALDVFFLHKGSQYRVTIEGKENIQKYCMTNRIQSVKMIKEIISKKLVPGFRPVFLEDYNLKVDLKQEVATSEEIVVNELLLVLETANKGFRMKKRYSFTPSHGDWRYDLTVVRRSPNVNEEFMSHKRFATTIVGNLQESFEVEIELLKTKKRDTEKLTKEFLKAGITTYAVMNGIENIITKTDKLKVLEGYAALWKSPIPSGQTMMLRPRSYFVGPQPVTLELNSVISDTDMMGIDTILNDYTVTEKADGERFIMYVDKSGYMFLINNKLDVFDLRSKAKDASNCIFDGEYITRDSDGRMIRVFAIFDVYHHKGKDVTQLPLIGETSRLSLMQDFVKRQGTMDNLTLHVKEFHHDDTSIFNAVKKVLSMVDANCYIYRIDGLIFTPKYLPVGALYKSGESNLQGPWIKVFKWKPPVENTIDMQVIADGAKAKKIMVDGEIKSVYTLHIGYKPSQWEPIKPKHYFEHGIKPDASRYTMIPFQPADVLDRDISLFYGDKCKNGDVIINNSIIEFAYTNNPDIPYPQRWVPLRIRKDKVSPNDYSTAMNVWRSIDMPVTEDIILGKHLVYAKDVPRDEVYYKRHIDRDKFASKNMMTFHNYWVKYENTIRKYGSGKKSLFDIACGKGGDLKRWLDTGFDVVFGIDKARDNIENPNDGIYARLHNMKIAKEKQYMFCTMDANEHLTAQYINGLDDSDKYVGKRLLEYGQFDIVSCQFAIHYFFKDESSLDVFVDNVNTYLSPGGVFIGTCLDGQKVKSKLAKLQQGQSLSGRVEDRVLWNIRKEYDDEEEYGNEIKIYMESIGMEASEYIVDIDLLKAKFAKHDIQLIEHVSFEDVHKKVISTLKPTTTDYYASSALNMSDIEKEYSFMNMAFAFQKQKAETVQKKKVVKKKSQTT